MKWGKRQHEHVPPLEGYDKIHAVDRWRLALYGEGALERQALRGRP